MRLTVAEKVTLAEFAALQHCRVPAQRRVMQELSGHVAKLHMQAQAVMAPQSLKARIEKAKARGDLRADVDAEAVTAWLAAGRYDITVDESFGMAMSLQMARNFVPAFCMKQLSVARSESDFFVTCDAPVVQIPDETARPMYLGVGFLESHVFLPIGRHTTLFWTLDDRNFPPERDGQPVTVRCKTLGGARVRRVGKYIIQHAERFVFGPEKNPAINKLFDKTFTPRRIEVSSPFDRRDEGSEGGR